MGTLLMVGTRKGLWLGRSDDARQEWSWTGPHFQMEDVYSAMIDRRAVLCPHGPSLLRALLGGVVRDVERDEIGLAVLPLGHDMVAPHLLCQGQLLIRGAGIHGAGHGNSPSLTV